MKGIRELRTSMSPIILRGVLAAPKEFITRFFLFRATTQHMELEIDS